MIPNQSRAYSLEKKVEVIKSHQVLTDIKNSEAVRSSGSGASVSGFKFQFHYLSAIGPENNFNREFK